MDIFAKRMEANQPLSCLMQLRRAWKSLKDIALTKAIGITTSKFGLMQMSSSRSLTKEFGMARCNLRCWKF
ncbi:mitochondrial oxaloacetate transport protein [Histoplasma capsulatum var. duboisii H88]|uniref:Mitochondrial oxaloacetate transport protein n=1 Tax=Ajellomyces capsulatus (strain H88) TaxID=544711 RepID=A0A8A1LLS5_AJEC8|nr:mitochondrial oxaloacetate transport protein [Histoplasma capsulatum var. duboisii H88]